MGKGCERSKGWVLYLDDFCKGVGSHTRGTTAVQIDGGVVGGRRKMTGSLTLMTLARASAPLLERLQPVRLMELMEVWFLIPLHNTAQKQTHKRLAKFPTWNIFKSEQELQVPSLVCMQLNITGNQILQSHTGYTIIITLQHTGIYFVIKWIDDYNNYGIFVSQLNLDQKQYHIQVKFI